MNKRQIVASLNKIAEQLDNNGLYTEANNVSKVIMKIAQYTGPGSTPEYIAKTDFINRHPILKQTLDILKSQRQMNKAIDFSKTNRLKVPSYWFKELPNIILPNELQQTINKLQNPNFQQQLAQKRLKFLTSTLEKETLNNNDRQMLLDDLKYLKKFTNLSSLEYNPQNQPAKKPLNYFENQEIEKQSLQSLLHPKSQDNTPKAIDYNEIVANIIARNLAKYTNNSMEEAQLMLSNKTNLQGYKIINENPNLEALIRKDIDNYSKKFIDGEIAKDKMSDIFSRKLLSSTVK